MIETCRNRKTPRSQALTPGYWKTHKAETTALLPVKLGNYTVDTFTKASSVFNAMNCGLSTDQGAIGCLAGHLLAAKLNVKNGSDNCINNVIQLADDFLSGKTVTYAGKTVTGINYTGPSWKGTLTADQRYVAVALKDALDRYNNGLGC